MPSIRRAKAIRSPAPEKLVSSSKAKYKLLHKRVYLVEEPKTDFSFRLFTDTLKGRCHDCEDDESFACESLDCGKCGLPCPCKSCTKYRSRAQGLVVTRRYPTEVRSSFYLQTTPMIWISTVAGKDNLDPAKLSLLTDSLIGFVERSQNGVVLVDGIEYLVTTNDFQKVLRTIDRWTDAIMTSSTRLVISVDPRSFDRKELALLERNREVVLPDSRESRGGVPERF